jgi:exodeoxyribonuclease VII large subunit
MSEPLPGLWDDQEWLPGWQEWTVGELTLHIKDLLELDPELQDVWLVGEVSNLTRASSGHLYFTLKDATAAIGCVMWRTDAARLGKKPEHGVEVRVHGRISVYAPRGKYQLIVYQMQPVGLGDLHARF